MSEEKDKSVQMFKEPKQDAIAKKQDENSVEFVPFGGSDKLRLTASMVRQFIAVPTKSGALPSERDCIRFIMLCRGKRANPFEGDCFLIGYDSQYGPSFSMVCGLELFQKRASAEDSYDGSESGVLVLGPENAIIERAGTLVMDEEKLIGGWAKVHRKDRKQVEYKSVKFSTYNTDRSRWLKDPGGMIAKVALSQALRGAYPTALGGLYTQEEMQRLTEQGDGLIKEQPKVLSEPQKPIPRVQMAQKPPIPADPPSPSIQTPIEASTAIPDGLQGQEMRPESDEPPILDQILVGLAVNEVSAAKLISLLRHDGILTEFQDLSKLKPDDAVKVLKTLNVYVQRCKKSK